MSDGAGRDEVTRDLRGADAAAVSTSVAPARPPAASPNAMTISDTGTGLGALAATLDAPAESPDLVGKSLDRYRVLARLGAGGMGVVYAALDPALDRKVALKVLPPLAIDRGAHLETRLRREAQALARLDHPNVVRVYDVGVAEQSVFVAMQLVDGATLADLLERERPPVKQILAMFVAAGRGLAAAHEAGIVHRDVKPSNILVDRAGRVYVGDFGLARGAGEQDTKPGVRLARTTDVDDATAATISGGGAATESGGAGAGASDSNLLDEAMTREGSVLGTPLYMSPEQHQGTAAAARSDQFSFCVSLWQALFDEHPFVGGRWNTAAAIDAMARDAVREPPSRGVPSRVIRALRRGMRHDPDARWPSMTALVDQLAPRSRARWVAAGLALAGVVGGVGGSIALGAHRADDPCASAGARLATVWGGLEAQQVRDGFARTKLPYADTVAGQAIARLDRWGGAWSAMRVDACRATRVLPDQSRALVDRRARCLDRRFVELGARVRILTGAPGPDVVDRALSLVDGLPSLDECADTAALAELADAPTSPMRGAEIAALDAQLATLHAQSDAGLATDPLGAAERAVAAARRLDDTGLLARALVVAADAHADASDSAGALALWREAAAAASRAHDDRTATVAMRGVAEALLHAGKPAEALVAVDDADLFVSRAAIDADTRAQLFATRANALDELNRFPEADAAYAQAMDLAAKAYGKDSPQAAGMMINRSKVLNDVGRYADTIVLVSTAIPILERELGAGHPELGIAHQNLGNAYLYRGEHALARAQFETALAIKRARRPGSASVAFTLQSLGVVEVDEGNLEVAKAHFQDAYDLRVKLLGAEHPDTMSSLYELGVATRMQGHYAEAREILDRVLAGRLHHFGEDHTSVANVLEAISNVDQAMGKPDAATTERRRALAIREKVLGPYNDDVALSLRGLAELAVDAGRCDEVRTDVARVFEIQAHNGAPWWEQIEPLALSAMCETRPAELAGLRAKLEPMVAKAAGGDDVDRRADSQFALGIVLWQEGEHAKGDALVEKGAAVYRAAGQPDEAQPMAQWLARHPPR